jgi:hypothetical protein
MFYLSWNGQDMMKYIYSSLDFLYECPLLVKWFGTGECHLFIDPTLLLFLLCPDVMYCVCTWL